MIQKKFDSFLHLILCVCVVWNTLAIPSFAASRELNPGDELVVCIDAGHGGDNEGTLNGWMKEMDMTIITANAIKDELETYDGIKVIMTRTDSTGSTLKERCELAVENHADFLFSIHYNASAIGNLYGSEIWIPSRAPYITYGYQFGYEFCKEMEAAGMFIRGIKTRLNNDGEDYYGIIREGYNLGLPCVILEHCHVDSKQDKDMCDTVEDMKNFGIHDATAIAKYFGLTKKDGSVSYSDYSTGDLAEANLDFILPRTNKDETEPEVVTLTYDGENEEKGELLFTVVGKDTDGMMLYYDYSTNNGLTFSDLQPWPGSNALTGQYDESFKLSLTIPSGLKASIILRGYNGYDLFTESDSYVMERAFKYNANKDTNNQDTEDNNDTDKEKPIDANSFEEDLSETTGEGAEDIVIKDHPVENSTDQFDENGNPVAVDENGNVLVFTENSEIPETSFNTDEENIPEEGSKKSTNILSDKNRKELFPSSREKDDLSITQIYLIIALVIVGSIFVLLFLINLINYISSIVKTRKKLQVTAEKTSSVDYTVHASKVPEKKHTRSSSSMDEFWLDDDLYDDDDNE